MVGARLTVDTSGMLQMEDDSDRLRPRGISAMQALEVEPS